MSDQDIITSAEPGSAESHAAYREYFARLGSRDPNFSCPTQHSREAPSPWIVWSTPKATLESEHVSDCELVFARAKELWEGNGGPEMWIFSHLDGPPWFIRALPPKRKGMKTSER